MLARAAVELDVVGLGECSLDEVWVVPALSSPGSWGGKLQAARRDRLGGGQVATAMVAAARLGLKTAYLGAVGDDPAGRQVLDGLRQELVNVDHVRVTAGGATRSALILVDGGERTVVEHAGVTLSPDEIDGAVIARARVLHVDATQIATSIAAARIAGAHGVVVSLDVDHARPGLDELLELVDICVTSEALPHQLSGESDLEQALRQLARRTGPFVCCTLGARGAAALDDGHLLLSPPFAVEVGRHHRGGRHLSRRGDRRAPRRALGRRDLALRQRRRRAQMPRPRPARLPYPSRGQRPTRQGLTQRGSVHMLPCTEELI